MMNLVDKYYFVDKFDNYEELQSYLFVWVFNPHLKTTKNLFHNLLLDHILLLYIYFLF